MKRGPIGHLQDITYKSHMCKPRKEWEVVANSGYFGYLVISGPIQCCIAGSRCPHDQG